MASAKMSTRMSTKGQVVLPSAVRGQLKLEPGTVFDITVEADRIVLAPVQRRWFKPTTIDDIRAFAAKYPPVPKLTDDEIARRMRASMAATWRRPDGKRDDA